MRKPPSVASLGWCIMVMSTSPSRLRRRPMARRSRDLTVPSGRIKSFRDVAVGAAFEEGKLDDHGLALPAVPAAPHARARSRSAISREPSGRCGSSGSVDLIKREGLGALVAAQPVDAQIARDRIDPGRGAGARWIELRGLAPNRQQRFLRNILGGFRARAHAHQHGLDPRRIETKQSGECRTVMPPAIAPIHCTGPTARFRRRNRIIDITHTCSVACPDAGAASQSRGQPGRSLVTPAKARHGFALMTTCIPAVTTGGGVWIRREREVI